VIYNQIAGSRSKYRCNIQECILKTRRVATKKERVANTENVGACEDFDGKEWALHRLARSIEPRNQYDFEVGGYE